MGLLSLEAAGGSECPVEGKRPREGAGEGAGAPAKRPRVYSRRNKRRAPLLTELDDIFLAVQEPAAVHPLVVSREEYLQQLREVFDSEFHGEFTFTLA